MDDDTYELRDTASSNLIGTYPTETDALQVVHDANLRLGEQSVSTIALGHEDLVGRLIPVATGPALVTLAQKPITPVGEPF